MIESLQVSACFGPFPILQSHCFSFIILAFLLLDAGYQTQGPMHAT
jgi:hypothetical protein